MPTMKNHITPNFVYAYRFFGKNRASLETKKPAFHGEAWQKEGIGSPLLNRKQGQYDLIKTMPRNSVMKPPVGGYIIDTPKGSN
jgi:hypothetical protein